tara:strand:+ start:327 stop:728 length:402 start_codon:yes stop_codon:yes gene_type:complete
MTKTKKILFTLLISLTAFSLGYSVVMAQQVTAGAVATARLGSVGVSAGFDPTIEFPKTVGGIIKSFISILGVIFMAYIVYAGYLWMIARGEEEKVTKAKAIIRGSIIGLIIVLFAYAITAFIVSRFASIALAS